MESGILKLAYKAVDQTALLNKLEARLTSDAVGKLQAQLAQLAKVANSEALVQKSLVLILRRLLMCLIQAMQEAIYHSQDSQIIYYQKNGTLDRVFLTSTRI